jgi:hypothetical protein
MPKSESLRALVLPGDAPPRRSSLKRLLLFFDSVTLIHPEDRALLNSGEIVEEYPGRISRIEWAERSAFQRSSEYTEVFTELAAETTRLQERGLLTIQRRGAHAADPLLRMRAYAAALPNEDLVRAAVPDLDPGATPTIPDTMLYGGAVAPAGLHSRYDVAFPEPYRLPEADAWSPLAWLRLGRALKFLEVAHWSGAAPVALDDSNQSICLALGTRAVSPGQPSKLATATIALDAVDPQVLDAALLDCSWADVLRLRREILPAVATLRSLLLRAARRTAGVSPRDLRTYQALLSKLRADLEVAQAEHARKWQELRIGGLLKAAGASAATGVGLEALVSPSSWVGVLQLLLATVAVAGATLANELKPLLSSYSRVRNHPLYFFDGIPRRVGREQR